MLRYYAAGITCVAVAPRRIRGNEYLLVCLRYVGRAEILSVGSGFFYVLQEDDASSPTLQE